MPLTSLRVCLFALAPHVHIYICINYAGVICTYVLDVYTFVTFAVNVPPIYVFVWPVLY